MISTRPQSPSRTEAIAMALRNEPEYNLGVLVGNWVENRMECPKDAHLTLYFPPKENIDYEKLKPELRYQDLSENKLLGIQGNIKNVLAHDGHDKCGNYLSTSDLVYNHLPKPLCGPNLRYYKKSAHIYHPQPDLMKCYGNITEWGLRNYKFYEWACTDVSDYFSSLYEDTYVAPRLNQYLPNKERKARNSTFTKSFQFKMTKPVARPKKKSN